MWIISIFIGSVLLSRQWFIERTEDLTLVTWVFQILPILVIGQIFYWYGFRNAPNFIIARYTMSFITHIFGILVVIFFLKEGISIKQGIGMTLMITGLWVMK